MDVYHLNRYVGVYYQHNTTFITWREQRHFFIKYRGLGISVGLVAKLVKLGCTKIIFIYRAKTGEEKYITTPTYILKSGIVWADQEDGQRILPLKLMRDFERTTHHENT